MQPTPLVQCGDGRLCAASRRDAAYPGCLNLGQDRAGTDEGASGLTLVDRGGGVCYPQRDAKRGVGPDLGRDHSAGALRREHQMNAQRPPALCDANEAADELGQVLREGRELVDNQHESRQCWRVIAPRGSIRVQILGADLGEESFPAAQFGVQ